METLFIRLVNLGISAGWLILAVLLLRQLLRRAPKWISCLLWGLVGLRLLLPFSMESVFSLVPSAETIPETIMTESAPAIDSGIKIIDYSVNPIISGSLAPNPGDSANPLQILTFAASVIWICGAAAMLLYLAGSYLLLRRKVRTATLLRANIRQSEFVDSPFILGILKPQIYIPYHLDEKALSHVLAHENAHLARKDYLIKPIAYIILAIYWFQPLIWISYILLCKDIELACDERVIRNLDAGQRKSYSLTLLACSTGHRRIAACPLAFGEVGVKERVIRVKAYKKPAFWIMAAALIACGIAALCFLTDPKSTPDSESVAQHDPQSTPIPESVTQHDPQSTPMPESAMQPDNPGKDTTVSQESQASTTVITTLEDADALVEALITKICSPDGTDTALSSNPQDYLSAHPSEYQELLAYGGYTLKYCLNRFEKGDETGLEGHIMARACEELLGTKDKIPVNAETASTGQEWYITLKAHGSNLIEPYVEIR